MFAIFLTKGMDPFYQNIASFPTVIFTFLLALVLLYWLVAVLGWVEIDILDFDLPETEGALDAQNNGLSTPDFLAGFMLRLGLRGVPVTVIVSLIALFGWLACYYTVHFLFVYVPDGLWRYLAGVPVLFGSLYVAALITALVIRPLRPLFNKAQLQTTQYILGQTARVRTSRVDNRFGEVTLDDGGAGLILKARSRDQVFAKGDTVVLLEYNKQQHFYWVVSEKEFTG